jgi:hypothetical protein
MRFSAADELDEQLGRSGPAETEQAPPNADDPTLYPGRDCELPMLLRMTLPTPKKVIRRSSLRGNLQPRFLCHYG